MSALLAEPSRLVDLLLPESRSELDRATALAGDARHTEACLRIGRAVEASLYKVGREFGLDLTHREITDLQKIRNEIDAAQAGILRDPGSLPLESSFQLIATLLDRARQNLLADEGARRGKPSKQPKNNLRLLKEIGQGLADPLLQFRFKTLESVASSVQRRRNQAAHADQEGGLAELDEVTYLELRFSAVELIEAAAAAMLGERARKAVGDERPSVTAP